MDGHFKILFEFMTSHRKKGANVLKSLVYKKFLKVKFTNLPTFRLLTAQRKLSVTYIIAYFRGSANKTRPYWSCDVITTIIAF